MLRCRSRTASAATPDRDHLLRETGSNVNRLIDHAAEYDSHTGLPVMTRFRPDRPPRPQTINWSVSWMLGIALNFIAEYNRSIAHYPNITPGEEFEGHPAAACATDATRSDDQIVEFVWPDLAWLIQAESESCRPRCGPRWATRPPARSAAACTHR